MRQYADHRVNQSVQAEVHTTHIHSLIGREAAALSGQAPTLTSAPISERSNKLFSGENKLGSPSKRLLKKPFLSASSKEPWLVNRHGEFTAQDIVGGTNGWSFTTTKAEEREWRGVIHHTLNKSKCD